MQTVRLGIIGAGGMAQSHMSYFEKVKGLTFTAVADAVADTVQDTASRYGIKGFDDGMKLLDSGLVDAVMIATPHYFHPTFAMAAFERGIHVLTEKPVAVTAKAAHEVNEAHRKHPELIYAAMFNQRTDPLWMMVHKMMHNGEVGELIRVSWTITTWFRTQSYYDSGGWRATWKGEGGGVLLNQCPHNLDLFQWFVGMPSKVTAQVSLGKFHDIEVEDDVTAMLQFPNGATGTFITSTGEAPGINRLEIAGDNGTLIASPGKPLEFIRNEVPCSQFCRTSPERFATPPRSRIIIEPPNTPSGHMPVTQNFVNAILHGEKLVAPGQDGLHGLELGNAILMSGLIGKPVDLPTDRDAFDKLLQDLIAKSTFRKPTAQTQKAGDLAGSF